MKKKKNRPINDRCSAGSLSQRRAVFPSKNIERKLFLHKTVAIISPTLELNLEFCFLKSVNVAMEASGAKVLI